MAGFRVHYTPTSLFVLNAIFIFLFLDGQSDVEAHLVVRKYVEKGSSVTLHCEHNVQPKILYKVSWEADL